MKLRNKKTGWITEDIMMDFSEGEGIVIDGKRYDRISDINNDWEDYEEPSGTYWLDTDKERIVESDLPITDYCFKYLRELGLAFTTKEEAEQAVEKLKAWKRLKDLCQISFNGVVTNSKGKVTGVKVVFDEHPVTFDEQEQAFKDLELLFGEEDE